MRFIRSRGSPADGDVIGGIVPDPATLAMSAPLLPTYLKRLRALGAWWGRGSTLAVATPVRPHEHVDRADPAADVAPIRRLR